MRKFDYKNLLEREAFELGEYYVTGLDRFNEGDIVKIYQHTYVRLLTFDKNDELYVIHQNQIHKNFITKKHWRDEQINRIIEKDDNKETGN